MKDKKLVLIFITTNIVGVGLFFISLFLYDPLQLFHKHWRERLTLTDNMRLQAAGLINNYDFDSFIIGTSMFENTSADEASLALGGKFINISLSASDFYERSFVLERILSTRTIKKIIYSLDTSVIINARKGHPSYPIDTYIYLYDRNRFNDFKAYLNKKYIYCLLVFSDDKNCLGTIKDFSRPNAWYNNPTYSVRYGGIHNWFKANNNSQIKRAFSRISTIASLIKKDKLSPITDASERRLKSIKYIERYLLEYVKRYPETEFYLIFPPYSRLTYAIEAQYYKTNFDIYLSILEHLIGRTEQLTNMKIYAWGNHHFVDDIANYKDPLHYEYKINAWMLNAIKRREGLLNGANIRSYVNTFKKKSLSFDLIGLGERIDQYLKQNYDTIKIER